jgi:hypothetical protein
LGILSGSGRTGGDLHDHSVRVSLDFVDTLFAHLQTHDIAKLAIKRPGLADAGSVAANSVLTVDWTVGRFRGVIATIVRRLGEDAQRYVQPNKLSVYGQDELSL